MLRFFCTLPRLVLTSHSSLFLLLFFSDNVEMILNRYQNRGVNMYQVKWIPLNENKQEPKQFMWNSQMMRVMIMIHNKSHLHKVIGPLRFQFIWLDNWWCRFNGHQTILHLLSSFSIFEMLSSTFEIETIYKICCQSIQLKVFEMASF